MKSREKSGIFQIWRLTIPPPRAKNFQKIPDVIFLPPLIKKYLPGQGESIRAHHVGVRAVTRALSGSKDERENAIFFCNFHHTVAL